MDLGQFYSQIEYGISLHILWKANRCLEEPPDVVQCFLLGFEDGKFLLGEHMLGGALFREFQLPVNGVQPRLGVGVRDLPCLLDEPNVLFVVLYFGVGSE